MVNATRTQSRQQPQRSLGDYESILKTIAHACIEVPMAVLGYCLMPNHFHLVVQPASAGDLSRWMHWLQNTHAVLAARLRQTRRSISIARALGRWHHIAITTIWFPKRELCG